MALTLPQLLAALALLTCARCALSVDHHRLLQSGGPVSSRVLAMVDPIGGYSFTFFNMTPAALNQSHQVLDLRPGMGVGLPNQFQRSVITAGPPGVIPSFVTLIVPPNFNTFSFTFSESCVFPIAAYSSVLPGLDASSTDSDATASTPWVTMITSDTFSIKAERLGLRNLGVTPRSTLSVDYPDLNKDIARRMGVYNQAIQLNTTGRSVGFIQLGCAVVDSPDHSWQVDLQSSVQVLTAPPAPSPNPVPLPPTNGTNSTNGTAQVDDREPRDHDRKVGLIVGLVIGLTALALILAGVFCCLYRRKQAKAAREEDINPQTFHNAESTGFKRFDDKPEVRLNDLEHQTYTEPANIDRQAVFPSEQKRKLKNMSGSGRKSAQSSNSKVEGFVGGAEENRGGKIVLADEDFEHGYQPMKEE